MSYTFFGYLSDDEEIKEYVEHSILKVVNNSDAKITAKLSKTGDTMSGDLKMNNNLVKGLPVNYPPNYEGDEAVSWKQVVELTKSNSSDTLVKKSGDTMSGDLKLLFNDDHSRSFGVTDINVGKTVHLFLGDVDNEIFHTYYSPVNVFSKYGTKFESPAGTTCLFGGTEDPRALFYQDITINGKSIVDLMNPSFTISRCSYNELCGYEIC